MRMILLIAALIAIQSHSSQGQDRFVSEDYSNYYEWFQEHSQAAQLYTDRTTLFTFGELIDVRKGPCLESAVVIQLPIGQPVQNIAYDEDYLPEDEINGYGDIWYHVRGKDQQGRAFTGYIWGGLIAKGWRRTDLTGDGQTELILLGIAAKPRKTFSDINAEIRIVKNNRLFYRELVPGLCVFEECDSDPLLRIIKDPTLGTTIVEATTMTIGCTAGIEKAFLFWNGSSLERVFQAEYTTRQALFKESFILTQKNPVDGSMEVRTCRYSHEDARYNPVWECKTTVQKSKTAKKAGKEKA